MHYFAYRADYKLRLLWFRISPISNGIYKLPFAKKHFEKKGYDPVETLKEAFRRPDIGISSIFAGGLMGGLIAFFCLSLFIYYQGIVRRVDTITPFIALLMLTPAFAVNHLFLFKNDKYLKYFKEFDTMPRKWKIKWAWISLGLFLGIMAFFIGSFVFMDYRLHH